MRGPATQGTHEYQPWTDPLTVQPVRCPCCGGEAGVWRYVEKPGAEVLRVVMCNAPEFEDTQLPMLLATCPLNMPNNSFYCQTARSAVETWNRYAENLSRRRTAAVDPLVEPLIWNDASTSKPDADCSVLLWLDAGPSSDSGWTEGWWDGRDWRLCESGGIADAAVRCWAEPKGPAA